MEQDKKTHLCKELLANISRFFEVLDAAKKVSTDDWLTVDDIAKELRISKSIVYRLVRNGEIEAVNLVRNGEENSKKGHYRIKRSCLSQYLEAKKVKPLPSNPSRTFHTTPMQFPKTKNHLGL